MKSKFRVWLGLVIGVFFLYLSLRGVDFHEAGHTFRHFNFFYLLIVFPLCALTVGLQALRWRILLMPTKRIALPPLFSMLMIGYLANNILPARLGDLARAYLVGLKEGISKSLAFATIVVERLFDIFSVLLLMAVLCLFFDFPYWVRQAGIIVAFVSVVIYLFFIVLLAKKNKADKFLGKIVKKVKMPFLIKIVKGLGNFIPGLQAARETKRIVPVLGLSLLMWFFSVTIMYILLKACSINIPVQAAAILLVVINIGLLIPSPPAYLGTYQFFCITALSFFSVGKSEALAFSIIANVTLYGFYSVIGLFYWWRESLSFNDIKKLESGD